MGWVKALCLEGLSELNCAIVKCRRCARLVAWREQVARQKKREFCGWDYWGKPVPGFGDVNARLLIVGLAPAAHGANRTGRMFTGDASGDWLCRALHKAGFASQPTSKHRDDGLALRDCYITATIHCAPPDNKPLPQEIANCSEYLDSELRGLRRLRVIVALGRIAFDNVLRALGRAGAELPKPPPRFAHGAKVCVREDLTLLASYHPSRQNTNTGRLTQEMFDPVWEQARRLLELNGS
jgi:uracil-DNA glycosylase family 4